MDYFLACGLFGVARFFSCRAVCILPCGLFSFVWFVRHQLDYFLSCGLFHVMRFVKHCVVCFLSYDLFAVVWFAYCHVV